MFKHLKEIFKKETKSLPQMNMLQRAIVTYSTGFIGRKSRKYYMKYYDAKGIQFESPRIMEALSRLQIQK